MDRDEIINIVAANDSTVLSFPNRGPWGDSRYRGNCSGFVPAYFIWKYGAQSVAEIFAGSGTTSDVCKDMGVRYKGIDLNPNPVRSNIIAMDILDESQELPDEFYNSDMLFLHPPYPSINDVRYSGAMWKDTTGVTNRDIQNMSWEQGMMAVNKAVMRGYAAMQPGSYEVILVGEIRSKGQYRSMYQNLALPGELHQTFIKLQHNTVSGRRSYGKSDFALTGHEMIAVIKKPSGYEIAYVVPKQYRMDIRYSKDSTWKDLVMAAARELGNGHISLKALYEELEDSTKAKNNPHYKEKIRQVAQQLVRAGAFANINRGVYSVA